MALSAAASSPATAPVSEPRYDAEEILALALARLDDDKAEDIVSIELRGKTTIADYMVVASGRSQRHVGAIADHLVEALKERGVKGIRVEGMPSCDWVLIDANDIIVHVFQPEVRGFYNIEKMWSGAHPGGATKGVAAALPSTPHG
ncbi:MULTISPECIES: ribosome silencing factor [unclassified Ancylobacter]|uniref:ribosome silencing factor n=1 Tax=unclassified Ancylobacter TaxID=2626613 RepID=UPI00226EBC4F|nr:MULTISPECIES: ribosome silencing factor [unclassified Ancylobacter]WAC29494.1 ribosome silencing factor [Ancylobacter sp. SL191]WGD32420.1 ribosome silencing factor [Ancylobacter sp. WKF20]